MRRIICVAVLCVFAASAHCQDPLPRPSAEVLGWAPLPALKDRSILVEPAVENINDSDSLTRRRAAFILGQVGTDAALVALEKAMEDPDRDVRIMAGVGLAQYGDAMGLAGCRAALYQGPEWLKAYAIYGLFTIDTPESKHILATTGAKNNPLISRLLADAQDGQPRYNQFPFPDDLFQQIDGWEDARDAAVSALVLEADAWFHAGDYDQAIRSNDTALFLDPQFVELYANSAWLLWSMGRHGAAITMYRRGIEHNPMSWNASFELGFYYYRHDQSLLALPHLKRSLELGAPPQFARTYAHALEAVGRLQDALEVWKDLDRRDDSGAVDVNLKRLQEIISAR
ncbi:MAG: HEAT repeat domain-containing protein [Armatimonadota bacterium]